MKNRVLLKMNDNELDAVIKIQGTDLDRKRKLTDKMIKNIRKKYSKGKTLKELAEKYSVNYKTIRYWVDENYKQRILSENNHTHYGKVQTVADRAAYKRQLVLAGKVKA